jgi:hypothetical protein
MLLTNKEKAFHEIAMHTDWSNHRKAAERSSWRKKHEPDKITRCPNRGRRHNKAAAKPVQETPPPPLPPMEPDTDPPCHVCEKPSEGYDFPCGHPICHPCFQKQFALTEGNMACPLCNRQFLFYDELVDEND